MDLVEEEDRRPPPGSPALAGALDHGADLGATGIDRRLLLEGGFGVGGGNPRQRRLAAPRGAVEDRAVRPAALDRHPQGRFGAEQVLLPDQLG